MVLIENRSKYQHKEAKVSRNQVVRLAVYKGLITDGKLKVLLPTSTKFFLKPAKLKKTVKTHTIKVFVFVLLPCLEYFSAMNVVKFFLFRE